VIPQALVDLEVADHGSDELIVTVDMRERKGEMDRRADAFLALPGGIGTLEELLEVWASRSLQMHSKPIVILDPWGDFDGLRELFMTLARGGFLRPAVQELVVWASSADEAMSAIEQAWALAAESSSEQPTAAEFLEAEL
jgi:uncharacterized protein (TIGR00730 family)